MQHLVCPPTVATIEKISHLLNALNYEAQSCRVRNRILHFFNFCRKKFTRRYIIYEAPRGRELWPYAMQSWKQSNVAHDFLSTVCKHNTYWNNGGSRSSLLVQPHILAFWSSQVSDWLFFLNQVCIYLHDFCSLRYINLPELTFCFSFQLFLSFFPIFQNIRKVFVFQLPFCVSWSELLFSLQAITKMP